MEFYVRWRGAMGDPVGLRYSYSIPSSPLCERAGLLRTWWMGSTSISEIALARMTALIADYDAMEISLASARYRTALLAGSVLIAALMIFQASKLWLAHHWVASEKLVLVERGAALVPDNGAVWDTLGHVRQWNLAHPDLPGAIEDYHKAVRADPRSAHYWMDLASAYEASGKDSAAKDAFIHAEAVYPDSAEVAFYYGNFLLRHQEYTKAFTKFRRATRIDSSLLPLAISRAWRATGDANQIIDQLLPSSTDAYLKAIDYFATIRQGNAALTVWSRLVTMGARVRLASTFPLFDELIREDRSADARRVWLQALAASKVAEAQATSSSLIWNSDFAEDFTGGGLGWRWHRLPGVFLSFESAAAGNGSRTLRLDFHGGFNVNLAEPFQYVPVNPGRNYHFHALMRTDAITTESGVRFSITDPNHPSAVQIATDNFTGTHGWTPVDANFTAGPATHFIAVRLVRPPSRLFDNKLGGTVWITDLSLVAANAEPEPHK